MTSRARLRRGSVAVALACLPVVGAPVLAPLAAAADAPAAAEGDHACGPDRVPGTDPLAPLPKRATNLAFQRMGMEKAHDLATGRGVKIAVIDSGIQPGVGGIDVRPLFKLPGTAGMILSGHGTIAAGHIGSDDGVAPDATIYDVRVFDSDGADTSQGQKLLTSGGLIEGIRAVTRAHATEQFDIVNISLSVSGSDPKLEQAVAELVDTGVIVVAAAGNATGEAPPDGTDDSDADVFPADYPGVLGVSAVPPDESDIRQYVLPNRDTDVAAPTLGAVSFNATGQRCEQIEIATSWAAAEVSGVLALLRERFPRDNSAQLITRLLATTEGAGVEVDGTAAEDPWRGAGVVEAHDALTRELEIGLQGKLKGSRTAVGMDSVAPPPPPQIDLFGSSRALLLWSGLVGGAMLALAFMLRPLVGRIRGR